MGSLCGWAADGGICQLAMSVSSDFKRKAAFRRQWQVVTVSRNVVTVLQHG